MARRPPRLDHHRAVRTAARAAFYTTLAAAIYIGPTLLAGALQAALNLH